MSNSNAMLLYVDVESSPLIERDESVEQCI